MSTSNPNSASNTQPTNTSTTSTLTPEQQAVEKSRAQVEARLAYLHNNDRLSGREPPVKGNKKSGEGENHTSIMNLIPQKSLFVPSSVQGCNFRDAESQCGQGNSLALQFSLESFRRIPKRYNDRDKIIMRGKRHRHDHLFTALVVLLLTMRQRISFSSLVSETRCGDPHEQPHATSFSINRIIMLFASHSATRPVASLVIL
ncbi:hypothetical protein EK21DRAFT_86101 [Setomelanomma holmii]|uniref:Uncharacterized protein n=1 Tax=Setomelanomma holmii TaxID=210430 RepID=A0A9P4HFN4_9PLEO|nr:hypothetical protein EK21DRAFT_86101 [Setomelanomma holmii]